MMMESKFCNSDHQTVLQVRRVSITMSPNFPPPTPLFLSTYLLTLDIDLLWKTPPVVEPQHCSCSQVHAAGDNGNHEAALLTDNVLKWSFFLWWHTFPLPLWCFPGGSAGKESTCNEGDLGLIPGLGKYPGEGKGYALQYPGLENSMNCIDHGIEESDTNERLSLPLLTSIVSFLACPFSGKTLSLTKK